MSTTPQAEAPTGVLTLDDLMTMSGAELQAIMDRAHPLDPAAMVGKQYLGADLSMPKLGHAILWQTFPDWELILVNDASTDGTSGICRRFQDPRIRIIDEIEQRGLAVRLNQAVNSARGKYIARMDAVSGRWFLISGLCVAVAQGLFFAAVAITPIMVVMPLLQLSLVFLLMISRWLNPHHEVRGPLLIIGVAVSIVGTLAVSIDTDLVVRTLGIPEALARILSFSI